MLRRNHVDPGEIARLLEEGKRFWLDLTDPEPDQLDAALAALAPHPTCARTLRAPQASTPQPVLEGRDRERALTFYGVREVGDRRIRAMRLDILVGAHWVVTVQYGENPPLEQARKALLDGLLPADRPTYAFLDALADSFVHVVNRLAARIDPVEDDPRGTKTEDLAMLRREVNDLDRVVRPQRALWDARRYELEALDPVVDNVFAELLRVSADIENARHRLAAAADLQLNLVTKQLTLIATIFLPLSFVTGFFGQNFKFLTDGVDDIAGFLVWGVGGLILAVLLLVLYFRRQRLF